MLIRLASRVVDISMSIKAVFQAVPLMLLKNVVEYM
jgi:hypothetical protein